MRKKFTELPDGSVISSIRQRKIQDAIFDIKDSIKQGADGFLFHIELFDDGYRNLDTVKELLSYTDLPVMIINYRTERDTTIEDDIKLNAFKIECIKAGANCVDIPANSFDFNSERSLINSNYSFASALPCEVSVDREAVKRQIDLIKEIHNYGGEVLISAHIKTWLAKQQTLDLGEELSNRGADIIKIINYCKCVENIPEMLDTTIQLKKKIGKKILYQPNDCYGKLLRQIEWMFGSSMILCHNRYTEVSLLNKPLIKDVLKAKEILKW